MNKRVAVLAIFLFGVIIGSLQCSQDVATANQTNESFAGTQTGETVSSLDDVVQWLRTIAKIEHPDIQGWSGGGFLTTGVATGDVSCQATFPKAAAYTVQFWVNPPTTTAVPGVFDALATITTSVQGGIIQRQISVGNGSAITIVGESTKVSVVDQTTTVFGANQYFVGIQIAPGTRGNTQNPPTLRGFQQANTLVGGGTLVLPIPPGAGVTNAELTAGALALAGLPVTIVGVFKNAAGQILKQFDPSIYSGFVPVPPNATQLEIDNLGAQSCRVQVAWGIDG